MEAIKEETIAGYNSFILKQEALEKEIYVSFVQFDNHITPVFEKKPIKHVELLNTNTFVPRGTTALYDAIGYTIDKTKKESTKHSRTLK